ncbi:MAG: TonB-dependent receptor [Alphaproteobacteria bacterium]
MDRRFRKCFAASVGLLAPAGLAIAASFWAPPVLAQTEIPEIVIVARRDDRAPSLAGRPSDDPFVVVDRAFQSVTVVSSEAVQRSGARTLGDLLGTQPGITSSSFAPGAASRPIIRGLDNYRIRIQENGIGSQDVSELGEDHAVPINPLIARRVEVIRGPAALRFGSQAIGGVVEVSTNRIPTEATPQGFSAETRTSVSSVDRGVDFAQVFDGRIGNQALHVDLYGQSSSDYAIPGGRQANSFSTSKGGSIGTSTFFEGGFVGASLSHIASVYGVPGFASAANRTRIDMWQTKLNFRGEYRPGGGIVDVLRFWAGGSLYRHNEESPNAGGLFQANTTFRNQEIEGRAEAVLRPIQTAIGGLDITVGTQWNGQSLGTALGAASLLPPAVTRSAAAYGFATLSLAPTTRLQAAGRIDTVRITGTGSLFPSDFLGASGEPESFRSVRQFTPLSASLGLLQDLPFGLVASATASYVERAPRAIELYARGPHDAPGTFEIGNPDLRKETARAIEVGVRRAEGPFRFEATAYHKYFSGFIAKRLTGLRCDDDFSSCGTGTELRQVVYTQRNATFTGAEIKAQIDLGEIAGGTFGIEGQYDVVRASYEDGSPIPRIAPQRLGGALTWRDATWSARVSLLHVFAVTRFATEETPTPGYNLVNAEIAYRHRFAPSDGFAIKEIIAGVVGTNLLDERMRNAVSFRKDEVLLPGRGVRAYVTVKF